MNNSNFVDFYELLELSPNANSETIERVFRYMAKKNHPDVIGNSTETVAKFKQLVSAYETLRDSEMRVQYDIDWNAEKSAKVKVVQGASAATDDCAERLTILQIFYGQRRQSMRDPGVSNSRIEDITGCPAEILDFHMWYFREKGLIKREESGLMSITAEGVDRIESASRVPKPMRRLTHEARLENNLVESVV